MKRGCWVWDWGGGERENAAPAGGRVGSGGGEVKSKGAEGRLKDACCSGG
jgi:hypothetical protein